MCYKGNCFYCIPVEKGCLVIAIISAIATGVALLASIILGLLTAAGIIFATQAINHDSFPSYPRFPSDYDGYPRYTSDDVHELAHAAVGVAGLAVGVILVLVGVASLIAFIFSVLLCNGICNRRPGQVKSYFVYGIVITVLAVIASVIELAVSYDPLPGIAGLIGCAIYSLFLVLVHHTYIKLCAGVVFKDHVRLVEDYRQ